MGRKPIRRVEDESFSPPSPVPTDHSEFDAKYPNLSGYLFDVTYEDNTPRTTSTLLFFTERESLKVCLHDRDRRRVFFREVASVEHALAELEQALLDDTVAWREKRSF